MSDFPIQPALDAMVQSSDGMLKYDVSNQQSGQPNCQVELVSDDDVFLPGHGQGQGLPANLPACPLNQNQPAEAQDSTFQLGRGLSVHGQKHIWDNVAGDLLEKIQHFEPLKARRRAL